MNTEQKYEPLDVEDASTANLDDEAFDAFYHAKVAELAELDAHQYDRKRTDVAKQLGVRKTILDAAVQAARNDNSDGLTPGFSVEPTEPWESPVQGAELLAAITAELKKYLAMPELAPEAVALWTIHTHIFDAFWCTPYLAIESPLPSCGKSTLLSAVGFLANKTVSASNISAAALFRTIEKYQPTLMLDEAETFLRHDANELRGIVNSGHSKNNPYVFRCVGDDDEPRGFLTYCPKAMCSIGPLPTTIESRSIVIKMRRKQPGERLERFREDRANQFLDLSRQSARWALDNIEELTRGDPEMPPGIADRAEDNWRPLLAIADRAGGDWPRLAREAAVALSGEITASDAFGVVLLKDIRGIFEETGWQTITPSDLCQRLAELEASPWQEFKNGRALTSNMLGRMLRDFGIHSDQQGGGKNNKRVYQLCDFEDSFMRYTPVNSITSVTSLETQENSERECVTDGATVTELHAEKTLTNQSDNGSNAFSGGYRGKDDPFEDFAGFED